MIICALSMLARTAVVTVLICTVYLLIVLAAGKLRGDIHGVPAAPQVEISTDSPTPWVTP